MNTGWKIHFELTFLTASRFFSFLSELSSDFSSKISPFFVVVKYFESDMIPFDGLFVSRQNQNLSVVFTLPTVNGSMAILHVYRQKMTNNAKSGTYMEEKSHNNANTPQWSCLEFSLLFDMQRAPLFDKYY